MLRSSAKLAAALAASTTLGMSATALAQPAPPAIPAAQPPATPSADPTPPPTANPPAEPAAPTASAPSAANPAAPATNAPPSTAQTITVGDEEIRSFALALVEVNRIQQQYQPQVEAASPEQRPAVEQEVNAKMVSAVQEQGLDPQTYNAISATAQENEELRARVQQELEQIQPTSTPVQ